MCFTDGATTGVFPFFANKGYHPSISINSNAPLSSERAHCYVTDLAELHSFLHSEMSAAQRCYQGPADACRAPPPDFQIRDQLFVKAKLFHSTCPSRKLLEKFLGPYSIIARPGMHSFTLKLPDFMCSIHLVFHVAQLEPATPNTIPERFQPPPPLVEVDSKLEYEIAEILDSKVDNHC